MGDLVLPHYTSFSFEMLEEMNFKSRTLIAMMLHFLLEGLNPLDIFVFETMLHEAPSF